MERPGLKRLLADIEAGHVDVVVVYKVDRLTRSLTDFARIVDTFDKAGASFVSITQSFNTTSSMGRLTLNVLLSFAQFEREVTGERIRDKIAASKAKGMWMGGILPLGYDSSDHVLKVNDAEAGIVRHIFARYLKLGSVHVLRDELERRGIRSKAWTTRAGRAMGGQVFNRGALYHLLQNRHYVGEIRHRDQSHPGLHVGIVDPKLFEAVQRKLEKNRVKRRAPVPHADIAQLTGKVFDQESNPYSPAFSLGRHGHRYGYYVRGDIQQGRAGDSDAPPRLPAGPLDAAILEHLQRLSGRRHADWTELAPMLLRLEIRAEEARLTLDADSLFGEDHPDLAMGDLRARLDAGERLAIGRGFTQTIEIAIPGRLQFRGGRTWRSHATQASRIDASLVGALKTAHDILANAGLAPEKLRSGAQAPTDAYSRRLARLAFLAPDIQAAVLEGRQPMGMTVAGLMAVATKLAWAEQRAAMLHST